MLRSYRPAHLLCALTLTWIVPPLCISSQPHAGWTALMPIASLATQACALKKPVQACFIHWVNGAATEAEQNQHKQSGKRSMEMTKVLWWTCGHGFRFYLYSVYPHFFKYVIIKDSLAPSWLPSGPGKPRGGLGTVLRTREQCWGLCWRLNMRGQIPPSS